MSLHRKIKPRKNFNKRRYEKMKKLLFMFLLAISMFTVTGCGNDAPPEEGEQLEDVEEEDEIGDGEIDDE
jgi:predicted small lipoprotein YifL